MSEGAESPARLHAIRAHHRHADLEQPGYVTDRDCIRARKSDKQCLDDEFDIGDCLDTEERKRKHDTIVNEHRLQVDARRNDFVALVVDHVAHGEPSEHGISDEHPHPNENARKFKVRSPIEDQSRRQHKARDVDHGVLHGQARCQALVPPEHVASYEKDKEQRQYVAHGLLRRQPVTCQSTPLPRLAGNLPRWRGRVPSSHFYAMTTMRAITLGPRDAPERCLGRPCSTPPREPRQRVYLAYWLRVRCVGAFGTPIGCRRISMIPSRSCSVTVFMVWP